MRIVPLSAAIALTACISTSVPREDREAISAEQLRRDVFALADDSMRGRWTPSPELERAAQFLAGRLARAGLTPVGDSGSFLQRFPIDAFQVQPDGFAVWLTGRHPLRLVRGVDYMAPFNTWANWNGSGPAVVVHGPLGSAASFDTSALAGRVLLVPGGWGSHYLRIANWKPAAIVWLDDVPAQTLAANARAVPRPTRRAIEDTLPLVLVTYNALAPLLLESKLDTATLRRPPDSVLRATPLADAVMHVRGRILRLPHTNPSNVVAMVRGRDPALRDEYVVYTAHYDHLGVGAPVNGDSIRNGADDNASGTAALLAVAEAYGRDRRRPRRSIIFAFVSAEEMLGLGARYFLDHPPVPRAEMVANINADMVGRNWRDTVVVVGLRHSDLGLHVGRVLSEHPELGLAATDSSTRPDEARNLEGWSDHAAFIRKGIPFLYFYSGMHADYHRVTDTAEKIDFDKLGRVTRLIRLVGLAIADADERPKWDAASYRRLVEMR